ncbi:MAG: class I SAM-dependent methyltransferase [Steroidobacteraceae bacterium]
MTAPLRRFESTVPYYARYRLGYPARLIERVIALVRLEPGDAVLDLGTGPGLLAIPFAAAGFKVTAADPEPAMLEAARQAARDAGVALELWLGGSNELAAGMGPFRLVTMGRSFHWMDRASTLAMLEQLVSPEGAVALFHDDAPKTAENAWHDVMREVSDRYGRGAEPHVVVFQAADYRTHVSYLLDSAFCSLDGVSVVIRHSITVDEIVGRAFSMSTCSREKLGDRAAAFEDELRAALREQSPSGMFIEIAELTALVATRARGASPSRCVESGATRLVGDTDSRPANR